MRSLIEEFLLFVLPFACFAGWLIVRRRNPFRFESWHGHKFWLTMLGLVLAIISLIYGGLTAERHRGAFVPPHMENGRLVPGRFDDRR
jgi:uncharacterized membrane protein